MWVVDLARASSNQPLSCLSFFLFRIYIYSTLHPYVPFNLASHLVFSLFLLVAPLSRVIHSEAGWSVSFFPAQRGYDRLKVQSVELRSYAYSWSTALLMPTLSSLAGTGLPIRLIPAALLALSLFYFLVFLVSSSPFFFSRVVPTRFSSISFFSYFIFFVIFFFFFHAFLLVLFTFSRLQ